MINKNQSFNLLITLVIAIVYGFMDIPTAIADPVQTPAVTSVNQYNSGVNSSNQDNAVTTNDPTFVNIPHVVAEVNSSDSNNATNLNESNSSSITNITNSTNQNNNIVSDNTSNSNTNQLAETSNNTNNNVIVISKEFQPVIPVAIANFTYTGDPIPNNYRIETIIGNDLRNTGLFTPVYADRFPQNIVTSSIDPQLWTQRNLNYLVVGSVNNSNGKLSVSYKLYSLSGNLCPVGQSCNQSTFTSNIDQPRLAAHETAQDIFEDIKGTPASFTGKLAYVAQPTLGVSLWQLIISDYDGYNPRVVYTSRTPIVGTTWGPQGNNVAFSVYGLFRTSIMNYNLQSGKTTVLVNHLGNNNAPAFSPNGKYLAYAGGYNGSYNIYTLNLSTNQVTNLTQNIGQNTEPSWYGNTIIFTSTRGSSTVPAIYQMDANGSNVHQISRTTGETTDAQISASQKYIAMINNNRVTLQSLVTGEISNITNTFLDESVDPSYYGNMLVYSCTNKYTNNKYIYMVSSNGFFQQKLPFQSQLGMYTSPSWSAPLQP